MTYSTNAIANYFLDKAEKEGKSISPMKLQKLLYYAYGWWMGYEDERLFDESIQAWNYGPVVESIYHEFKRFGNDPIKGRAGMWAEPDSLEVAEKEGVLGDFLDTVWSTYGNIPAVKLSNMTHLPGTPWSKVSDQYEGSIPSHTQIPDSFIREHFKARAEKAAQKANKG